MARVLVVDDEPAVRRALERALRLENYEVRWPPTASKRSTRSPTGPPTR